MAIGMWTTESESILNFTVLCSIYMNDIFFCFLKRLHLTNISYSKGEIMRHLFVPVDTEIHAVNYVDDAI